MPVHKTERSRLYSEIFNEGYFFYWISKDSYIAVHEVFESKRDGHEWFIDEDVSRYFKAEKSAEDERAIGGAS
jgi:hypothetical protein